MKSSQFFRSGKLTLLAMTMLALSVLPSDAFAKPKWKKGPPPAPYSVVKYTPQLKAITKSAITKGQVDQKMSVDFLNYAIGEFKKMAPTASPELWKWMAANPDASLDFTLDIIALNPKPVIGKLAALWKAAPQHAKKYPKLTLAQSLMETRAGKTMAVGNFFSGNSEFLLSFKWYVDNLHRLPIDIRAYPNTLLATTMNNSMTIDMRKFVLENLVSAKAKAHPKGPKAYLDQQIALMRKKNQATQRFPSNCSLIHQGGACMVCTRKRLIMSSMEGKVSTYCTATSHAFNVGVEAVKDKNGKTVLKLTTTDGGRRYKPHTCRLFIPTYLAYGPQRIYHSEMPALSYNKGVKTYNQTRLAALLLGKHWYNETTPSKASALLIHSLKRDVQAFHLWEIACKAADDGKVSIATAHKICDPLKTTITKSTSTRVKKNGKWQATKGKNVVLKSYKGLEWQYYPHHLIANAYIQEYIILKKQGKKTEAKAAVVKFGKLYKESYGYYDRMGKVVAVYGPVYLEFLQKAGNFRLAAATVEEYLTKGSRQSGGSAYGHPSEWAANDKYWKYFAQFGFTGKYKLVKHERKKRPVKVPVLGGKTLTGEDPVAVSKTLAAKLIKLPGTGDLSKILSGKFASEMSTDKLMETILKAITSQSTADGLSHDKCYRQLQASNYGLGDKPAGNVAGYKKVAEFRKRYDELMLAKVKKDRKYNYKRYKFIQQGISPYRLVHGQKETIKWAINELQTNARRSPIDYIDFAAWVWAEVQKDKSYSTAERVKFLKVMQGLFANTTDGNTRSNTLVSVGAKYLAKEAQLYAKAGDSKKAFDLFKNYLMTSNRSIAPRSVFSGIITSKGSYLGNWPKEYKKETLEFLDWYRKNYGKSKYATSNMRGELGPLTGTLRIINQAYFLVSKKGLASFTNPKISYTAGQTISIQQINSKSDKSDKPGAGALTKGGKVYYTIDGSFPTTRSKLYRSPFKFPAKGIVRAMVIDVNGVAGLPVSLKLPMSSAPVAAGKSKKGKTVAGIVPFKEWFAKRIAKHKGLSVEKVIAEQTGGHVEVIIVTGLEMMRLSDKFVFSIARDSHDALEKMLTKNIANTKEKKPKGKKSKKTKKGKKPKGQSRGKKGATAKKVTSIGLTIVDRHGNRIVLITDGKVSRGTGHLKIPN